MWWTPNFTVGAISSTVATMDRVAITLACHRCLTQIDVGAVVNSYTCEHGHSHGDIIIDDGDLALIMVWAGSHYGPIAPVDWRIVR